MWRLDLLRDSTSYLDSNVLIYAFEGPSQSAHRRRLAGLFDDLAQRKARACVSVLTRTEVLVQPLRDGDVRLATWYRQLLSGRGIIGVLAVNQPIADLAAELRAERPTLRLPDAVHLATALHNGCDNFVTGDRQLAAAADRIRVLALDELTEDA